MRAGIHALSSMLLIAILIKVQPRQGADLGGDFEY